MFKYITKDAGFGLPYDVGKAMVKIQRRAVDGFGIGKVVADHAGRTFEFQTGNNPPMLNGNWNHFARWMTGLARPYAIEHARKVAVAAGSIHALLSTLTREQLNMLPAVNVDQDGVLADFDLAYPLNFEVHHLSPGLSKRAMWDNVFKHPNFFGELPVCNAARVFMCMLEHVPRTSVLTACPHSFYRQAANQKREFLEREFSGLKQKTAFLPVVGGVNKCVMMNQPGDVLIDDHQPNIEAWEDAGGTGILHDNFVDTSERLLAILKERLGISQ